MTKPADMTAAPVEINGIKFHPLTMNDWGEIDRWMQKSIMDEAIDTIKRNNLTGELLREVLSAAQKQASMTSTATEAGFAKLNGFDGFIKMMELASKGVFNRAVGDTMDIRDFEGLVERMGTTIIAISQPETDGVPSGNGEDTKKK